MLHDVGIPLLKTLHLWCENIGATYISIKSVYHVKIKHIDTDFHFIKDLVAAKALQISFYNSKDQIANVLTKLIVAEKFKQLRTSLDVVDISLDSIGRINISDQLLKTFDKQ